MATLDATNLAAMMFTVDTEVTAPDGNIYTAVAGVWYGVPHNSRNITVNLTDPVLCMSAGSHLSRSSGSFVQVGTVDEVRTPV